MDAIGRALLGRRRSVAWALGSVAVVPALLGAHTLVGNVVPGFELPVMLWGIALAVASLATVSTVRHSLRRGRDRQLRDLGIEEVDDGV